MVLFLNNKKPTLLPPLTRFLFSNHLQNKRSFLLLNILLHSQTSR